VLAITAHAAPKAEENGYRRTVAGTGCRVTASMWRKSLIEEALQNAPFGGRLGCVPQNRSMGRRHAAMVTRLPESTLGAACWKHGQ
jgi:hypothetical protein